MSWRSAGSRGRDCPFRWRAGDRWGGPPGRALSRWAELGDPRKRTRQSISAASCRCSRGCRSAGSCSPFSLQPRAGHFPKRNQVMAAPRRPGRRHRGQAGPGTRYTAEAASRRGRRVLCFPGSPGTLALLQGAQAVHSVADVISCLAATAETATSVDVLAHSPDLAAKRTVKGRRCPPYGQPADRRSKPARQPVLSSSASWLGRRIPRPARWLVRREL